MKTEYAQVVVAAINDGMSIEDTLVGLKRVLEKKHHEKLYAAVLLEVVRTLEAKQGSNNVVVAVAKASDRAALKTAVETALKDLGVTAATPVFELVDETLIGGFVATYDYTEYDQSYKKALKSLYESIVK